MNTRAARSVEVTLPRIFAIALPMTIAYASEPLLGLVDTGVAGRLNDVSILAGLAIGAVLFDLIWGAFNFLRSSVVGLTAQAFGEGDDAEMDAVFFRAMLVAIFGGIVVVVSSPVLISAGIWFFDAEGALANVVRTYFLIRVLSSPMALANYAIIGHFLGLGRSGLVLSMQLLLNGANMALSIILGLWLEYGIVGIAAATVIGESLAMLVGLVAYWHSSRARSWPSRSLIMDRASLSKFFALNRDITIRSFCLIFAFLLFTRVGAEFGENTLAANAVLMHVFLLSGFLLDGFATAAEQMAGQSLGAKDRNNFQRAVRLTVLCGLIFSIVLFLIYWALHGLFIDTLVLDQTVRDEARQFIFWAAFTPIAGFVAFQMDGVYIGASWGKEMRDWMLVSFAIFVALALLAQQMENNSLLWLALNVFLAVRGITLFGILPRKIEQSFGPLSSGNDSRSH